MTKENQNKVIESIRIIFDDSKINTREIREICIYFLTKTSEILMERDTIGNTVEIDRAMSDVANCYLAIKDCIEILKLEKDTDISTNINMKYDKQKIVAANYLTSAMHILLDLPDYVNDEHLIKEIACCYGYLKDKRCNLKA